jgi:hypothetical protein
MAHAYLPTLTATALTSSGKPFPVSVKCMHVCIQINMIMCCIAWRCMAVCPDFVHARARILNCENVRCTEGHDSYMREYEHMCVVEWVGVCMHISARERIWLAEGYDS